MDIVGPLIPAVVLGGSAYMLREKAQWWFLPLLVFFVVLGIQVFTFLNLAVPPAILSERFEVTFNLNLGEYLPGFFLTSLYFSALALIFTLAGMGVEKLLRGYVASEVVRYMVAAYITLLLLELWLEVFEWTLLVPFHFYSYFR